MEFDPYEYLEDIQSNAVVNWALSESRACIDRLNYISNSIFSELMELYTIPIAYNFKRNSAGVFFLKREKSYTLNLIKEGEVLTVVDSANLGDHAVIHDYYLDSDGRTLAYFYTLKGSDVGELVVINLRDFSLIDSIHGSISDVIFLKGGDRYYYVKFFRSGKCPDDVEAPCERVFLREDSKDELVFGYNMPRNHYISLLQSTDGSKALVEVSYGWIRETLYAGTLEDPCKWTRVLEGDFRAKFIDSRGDHYFAVVYDGNKLGRILRIGVEGVDAIASEAGEYLQDAIMIGDHIVASYLKHASSYIKIYDLEGGVLGEFKFFEPVSVVRMYSYGGGGFIELRYFTKPYEVIEVLGAELAFKKIMEHPKVFSTDIVEDFAISHDGTRVHFFWIKSPTGSKNVVVYGYGGFSVPLTPFFTPWIPILLKHGVDVVVVNLRGGSEYGEKWHEAGMKRNKMNVFHDYIAVVEKFKSMGFRVAGFGRSSGGLLIGAVMTLKPSLLDVAAIGYPVLDMLKFHKLYVGAAWIPEYGDPEDRGDREYLLQYSPYHNLKEGEEYPPTIVYTGLYDDRVHPAHALKFYAKMKSFGNNVCLRIEASSGHSGSSPQVLAMEMADVLSFILLNLSKAH